MYGYAKPPKPPEAKVPKVARWGQKNRHPPISRSGLGGCRFLTSAMVENICLSPQTCRFWWWAEYPKFFRRGPDTSEPKTPRTPLIAFSIQFCIFGIYLAPNNRILPKFSILIGCDVQTKSLFLIKSILEFWAQTCPSLTTEKLRVFRPPLKTGTHV